MTRRPISEATFRLYRRQARVSIASAGVIALVLLAAPLLFGLVYYGTDLMRSDVSYLCVLRHQWQHDEGLLLSSTIGNGYFLWGHPVAQLLYPVRWLTLLFEPDLGASVGAVLHLALGATAATWLAQTFRLRPWIAGVAGLSFTFTGISLDLFQRTFCIIAAAWVPLAWAAGRVLLRPRAARRHVVLLAIALVMLLLGGETHEFAIACALLVGESVAAWLRHRKRVLPRIGRLAIVIVGALAVGLLVLLPASVEAQLTFRSGLLSERESLRGSLSSVSLLGLIWPDVVLHTVQPDTNLWNIWLGHAGSDIRWDVNPFVGALLLLAGLLAVRRKRTRTAAIVFVFAFLMASGEHTPVMPVLLKIFPPLRLFRYPAKYALVGSLGLIVCAFATIQLVLRSERHRKSLLILSATCGSTLLIAGLALHGSADRLAQLARHASESTGNPTQPQLRDLLTAASFTSAAWMALAVGILAMPPLRRFLPLVPLAQLLSAVPGEITLGPALTGVTSPLAGQVETICLDPRIEERTWSMPGVPEDQSVKQFQRTVGLPDTGACSGLISPVPYAPFQMRTTAIFSHELQRGRVSAARALGCTQAVLLTGGEGGVERSWPVEETKRGLFAGLHLTDIPDPTPPAFISRDPRLLPENDLIPAVLKVSSSASTLSLADDPLHRLTSTSLPGGGAAGTVEATWSSRTAFTLTATGTGPAVLGVRSTFLAGWRAWQGSLEIPVIRIAGQELGAVVPDVALGPVTFRYAVPRLKEAIVCSVIGLLLIVLAIYSVGRTQRKPRSGSFASGSI
jgi:hypothetical protein